MMQFTRTVGPNALARPSVIEFTPAALHVDGRLGVSKTIFGDDFRFLQDSVATNVPKLTNDAQAVSTPEQADVVLAAPADVVGESLFVCVVPSDPVSWIAAQLDPGGAAILAVAIADELLLTYRVHVDAGGPGQPRSGDETVADIVRARPIIQPVSGSLAVS